MNSNNEWINWYLAGFVDGEGSFNLSFRKRKDYRNPWKVSLCFNISQKDKKILSEIKNILGCGTLRGRPDNVWYYEVNNLKDINSIIIPYFQKYGFISEKKKRDFQIFVELASIINKKQHLSIVGIKQILLLRAKMNDGGKRKYSENQIIDEILKNPQRSYAKHDTR